MTLRLILTRHAKSSWVDPIQGDQDRPLSKRGRASARAVGAWLAAHGYRPDQAMVSSAARTRETWKLIAGKIAAPPKPAYLAKLYQAEPEEMLHILRTATGRAVMMLGHNPGVAYFAQGLAHQPPADSHFERFPTGATTVIDFAVESWDQLAWRTGKVVDFVAPRDLIAQD
ncbi:MAG: phosphoglycerate mutase [Rhodobacterales bacterium CG2_30_65_12]|nr:MAG: phosphoglycerate mutase [Rhodobacterales bacterium CG2_30_65_12]